LGTASLLAEPSRSFERLQLILSETIKKSSENIHKEVMPGKQSRHYSSRAPMHIRNAFGKLARNDSDNADLMREHYHGVFNSTEAPVNTDDATDKLRRRSMCNHLSTTPTANEIIKVILTPPQ
jgi:hypothetical protein